MDQNLPDSEQTLNAPTDTSTHNDQLAPSFDIPSRAITVIEHPSIIKNIDKGIKSLGGHVALSKILRSQPLPIPEYEIEDAENPQIYLPRNVSASLRPDDPLAKRITATPVSTKNLLLKITVPKRTGRKRKKGSNDPFLHDDGTAEGGSAPPNPYVDARIIFRSIQDNASKYSVVPVGVIDESHRFRTLPDIQWASEGNKELTDIKEHLLPLRYSQLKEWKFNTEPGSDLTRYVGLTPEFFQMPVHYNYKFQQNPFVKYTGDGREEVNVQKRLTVDGYHLIAPTAKSVPTGPKSHIPPEHTLTPFITDLIAEIRAELRKRPIITRHLLFNRLGWDKRERIREAAVYCGYFFTSGPWREALIVWGLDPRTDPRYRHYQTISFISFLKIGTTRSRLNFDKHVRELARTSPERLATEHIFDGVTFSETGNLFQFCDITDPLIRQILDTRDIRDTCAPTFPGWYHIGTWAKATVIMKDKMNTIISGQKPDNSIYQRVLQWPSKWNDREMAQTYRSETTDKELKKEKAREHIVMYNVRCAARNPRYAFERMQNQEKERGQRGNQITGGDVGGELEESDSAPNEDEEIPEDFTEAQDTADAIMREGEDDEDEDEDVDEGEDGDEDDDDDDDDDEDDEDNIEGDGFAAIKEAYVVGVRDNRDELGPELDEDEASDTDDESPRQAKPFGGLYPTK